jgi:hypothetical protein
MLFMKNFSREKHPCKFLSFMVLRYPKYLRYPYARKNIYGHFWIYWTIFLSKWYFTNLQQDFSELGITVFLEDGLGSFQTFLIFQIWDKPEVLKRFQKQFWKLNSNQRNHVYFGFRKYLVVSSRIHSILNKED